MESFTGWLARHPAMVGMAFACLTGATAYRAFRGGVAFAQLRAQVGDRARAASEALGG